MQFFTKDLTTGVIKLVDAISTFTGVANQIIQTNLNGKIDPNLLEPVTGVAASCSTTEAGNLLESINLNVSTTVTGFYNYTFNTPLPNSTYSVVATPADIENSTDVNLTITNRSANGFRIEVRTGDNGATADIPVNHGHNIVVVSSLFSFSPVQTIDPLATDSLVRVATGTDLTRNYNIDNVSGLAVNFTDLTEAPLNGTTFFSSTTDTITTNFAGRIEIVATLPFTSVGQRVSVASWIVKNSTPISARVNTYIRGTNNHARDTNLCRITTSCLPGDTFQVRTSRSEVGGVTNPTFLFDIPTLEVKRVS